MELVKLADVGGFAASEATGWKSQMGDGPPPAGPFSALRSRLGLPTPDVPPPAVDPLAAT